jgi:hypothetical protein
VAVSSIDSFLGEMRETQGTGAAAWFTVNDWPAIVRVPLRAAPLLAATVNPTEPLPVPVAPDVIVIHSAFVVAVHVQSLIDDTATGAPVPPVAAID